MRSVVLCITMCMESSLLIFFASVSLCYHSAFVCITTCEHMLQRLCIFFFSKPHTLIEVVCVQFLAVSVQAVCLH